MRTSDRPLWSLALVGLVFFTTLSGGFTAAALFDVETAEVSLTVAGNAGPSASAQGSNGPDAHVAGATPTPEPTREKPTAEPVTETQTAEPTTETPTPDPTTETPTTTPTPESATETET